MGLGLGEGDGEAGAGAAAGGASAWVCHTMTPPPVSDATMRAAIVTVGQTGRFGRSGSSMREASRTLAGS